MLWFLLLELDLVVWFLWMLRSCAFGFRVRIMFLFLGSQHHILLDPLLIPMVVGVILLQRVWPLLCPRFVELNRRSR